MRFTRSYTQDSLCEQRWTCACHWSRLRPRLGKQTLPLKCPYRIHTILTDNGIQFTEQPRNRNTAWSRQMRFDMICEANDIEHRLTKPNHP